MEYKLASLLILTKGSSILLLKRFNTGYEDGKWDLVSGHVEQGESPTHAAAREAQEEIGVFIAPKDLQPVHVFHRFVNSKLIYINIFFTTEIWQGTPYVGEPHKCSEISWFDSSLPLPPLAQHLKLAFPAIEAGLPYRENVL